MVCDVAVIVWLAKVSQNEKVKTWIILEGTAAKLEHFLVTILRDFSAHQTLDVYIHFLLHIFHQNDFAHVDGDF